MKKIYTTALMLALGVSLGFAQNAAFAPALVKTNVSAVSAEEPVITSSPAALGDTINNLYYDFSAAQTNWTFTNTSNPSYDWEIVTAIPQNLVSLNYDPVFNSGSGGEFAIANSDGEGSGTSQECIIQLTNPVDLSGQTAVNLVWQQYYRVFTGDEHYVEYSTDGGTTWVSTQVNGGASADPSDNPEFASLNLGAAAGESSVLVRFRFVGAWGLWWAIDDVAFTEGAGDDLRIDKVYFGDVINDWEYAITPVAQTVPVYLGVFVTNNGGNTATNVLCEYEILLDGSAVDQGSFPVGDGTIESTATDTGWYDTGYTPSTVGVYTVNYTVSFDATDAIPADNEASAVFETSEYEWSHEREELWDGQYGGYVVSATDQTLIEYSQGSVFYPVVSADLYAIKVSFGASTSASSNNPIALTVEVHEIGANIQDIVDSEIQAADIEDDGWQTFVLDDPLPLNAGTGYILAVTTPGGEDVMVLDGWGVDDDLASANYGPFGTGGAVNWFNGWDFSSAIRAVFDPTVDVQENEDVSGVNIYPNPATDDLTVNFVSKEDQDLTVNVISATGALVAAEQVTTKAGQNSRLNFNVQELSAGIYMVRIQGATSTLTERVVVQ